MNVNISDKNMAIYIWLVIVVYGSVVSLLYAFN